MTRRRRGEGVAGALAVALREAFGDVLPVLERTFAGAGADIGIHPAVSLTAGDPVEVLARIDRWAVHVELPRSSGTATRRCLVGERQRSFALDQLRWLPRQQELEATVAAVRAERLTLLPQCAECGEANPPEWMHDTALCSRCAERNHGIVY
jgi:hypothetical protein